MQGHWYCALAAAGLLLNSHAFAGERVVAATDVEALFHSNDPKLDANKQIAYHILKYIPEATTTEPMDTYLTERYIQHNPFIPSGRAGMKKMFAIMKPRPVTEKLTDPVVSVVAEGDYVIVSSVQEEPDPKNPGKTTSETHFDMWRMKDGKADEHWDSPPPAGMGPPPGMEPLPPAQ
jgi:predicted SnoaL-like aldol condensation-catalyzing enzyme